MPYNLTLVNSTGIVPLAQTVNSELMQGLFGSLTLLTVVTILMMSFFAASRDGWRSLAYSTTIGAILSIPLRAISLVPDITVLILWVIAGITALVIYAQE